MTAASKATVTDDSLFAATFCARELIEILQPLTVLGQPSERSGAISTDSRSLQEGQWYLALRGENHDGHRFLPAAIAGGAAGCIISEIPAGLEPSQSGLLIQVADTLAAYHAIAAAWLRKVGPFVIAVTGSSGKTTTKEMCAAVVSSVESHKSSANENNEFGLPKTVLSMPPTTKILVAEMAMRGLGQIALLARTARPDAAIVTGVGTAHIELLGSAENIIAAKCEIFEELAEDGLAIIGDPTDALIRRARSVFNGKMAMFSSDDVEEIAVDIESTRFRVKGFNGDLTVRAHGIRHLQDAWCAVIAARAAGLSQEAIAAGLAAYRSVEGRGNRIVLPSGAVLIDESYNANPDSVRCAVEALLDRRAFPQTDKYIVLGEMAELGESSELMHRQIGDWLKGKAFTLLITIGAKAAVIARAAHGGVFDIAPLEEQSQAVALLQSHLRRGDACVMVKGSHCANLDRLVANLSKSQP